MNTKKITIYSTPTCPYCVFTKDFFRNKGIAFNDVDVTKDRSLAQEMVNKSGQMGVPVIDIDGNIIVGYQPAIFDKILAE